LSRSDYMDCGGLLETPSPALGLTSFNIKNTRKLCNVTRQHFHIYETFSQKRPLFCGVGNHLEHQCYPA